MATKKETKPKAAKTAKKTSKKIKEEAEEIIIDGNVTSEDEKCLNTDSKAVQPNLTEAPKSLGNFKDEKPEEEKTIKPTPEELQASKSWREYKEDETAQEMGDRLQKDADEHKKKLEEITSIEELDKMEKEIVETLDEFDKYIKQKRYELPQTVVFDGAAYSKSQIGVKIARALNKKEVTWQYSLGLYQLHKLWSEIRNYVTIPYDAYDSTVRVLGDITFKGMNEWKDILVINEFFVKPNKEFYKDSTMLIYYSTLHSQILQRKQMLTPVGEGNPVEGTMKTIE